MFHFRNGLTAVVVASGLLLAACEEQSSTPPATATPAADAHEGHDDHDGHDHAQDAMDQAKKTANDSTDAIRQSLSNSKPADTVRPAALSDESKAWVEKAKPLIEQATNYIKENKYDLAQQAIDKLNEMKDHLPTSLQDQVANLQKMLDTAKGAGGVKLPGT